MRYLSEIGAAWRPLLAATLGMGTGMSIIGTVTSAIAPSLVADAGWSKAQFAMTGMLGMLTALSMPFIGRLADLFGVKLTALIGIVAMPLTMLGFSLIGGSFEAYLAIFIFQSIICVTTTATVYTRLVVQHIEHARGLGLAIVACGPALFAAIGGPVINEFVEAHGWSATYRMLALFTVLTGIVVFLLIPSGRAHAALVTAPKRRARDDYPEIFGERAFWILFGAMYLCNLPLTLILVQLKMLVLDQGISGEGASIMFTALAVGMLLGRFVTGVALDRFAPQVVSFVMLALPGLGLFVLASNWDAPAVVTAAIFSLGFAVGAEGDILAFLVARHFRTRIYSSVLGLLTGVCSLAAASGAALLSWTLARTGSFDTFLVTVGTSVFAGALLLLMLRKGPQVEEALGEPVPA
ncbi:Major facilitator superfamily protein [Novosphingobium resinovorum]|uniref:Major facilitator superfamily protein n=1 Tax=Novosphingobium resinovorum TaxID=158500 RepID=A0A031JVD9_9SPHN|nr:MFS transporter [Novosphingobium resinovorum]EZP80312.1 Major facilitator superfamily protein [Novosphingobium resinovorum]